jgi:hypothetical protein
MVGPNSCIFLFVYYFPMITTRFTMGILWVRSINTTAVGECRLRGMKNTKKEGVSGTEEGFMVDV